MDRYQYKPLNPSTKDIRLVTILPGQFDDAVHVKISHVELVPPPETKFQRPPLEKIKKTLPEGWELFETLERRLVYRKTSEWKNVTWKHPDPDFDVDTYDPVSAEATRDKSPPRVEYEALSYCWGQAISKKKVIVEEGPDEDAPALPTSKGFRATLARLRTPKFTVTQGLDDALRYLRYTDRPRTMWIDALCINQRDIAERNAQVPRMGEIYTFASRVVAWLGPGSPSTKLALETLEYLGKQMLYTRTKYILQTPEADDPALCFSPAPPSFNDSVWDALASLGAVYYFTRLWIVQEIHLGNPATTLIRCGEDEIPWALFRRAILYLSGRNVGVPPQARQVVQRIGHLCDVQDTRIHALLSMNYIKLCKDSRDKVYGMMNLASPETARTIKVDYSLSHLEVFKQVYIDCAAQEQRLQQLEFARKSEFSPTKEIPSWPTWLPYWPSSQLWLKSSVPSSLASGISASRTRYVDSPGSPGKLQVTAVPITTITRVDQPVTRGYTELLELLRAASTEDETRDKRYPTGESYLDAYTWTLFEGRLKERHVYPSFPTVAQIQEDAFAPTGKDAVSDWYKYIFSTTVRPSGLFRTSTGHLGMATEAQPGKVYSCSIITSICRS